MKEFSKEFIVRAHGTTMVKVMYINEPESLKHYIVTLQRYLQEDKHKVVGLDLVYTHPHPGRDQQIAITLVCERDQALVYHYCTAMRGCGEFATFLHSDDWAFTMVDTRNNATVLHNSAILCKKLVVI